ncbi:GLPGLI family protein [Chryseobacterium sp. MFBS3-17]|uniref:GLPGLI family protein n=1 Tax=Chryseobacterium sp. MFBS3-17 TaxID=2886689 RepID=UPI001D0E072D|nr:GLPGLI family protein [Chryseobacterium sp. MFBS3-17]MCC2590441.1 GLPGLI family protein [Chryseobacterium sp. MFBS3-17]
MKKLFSLILISGFVMLNAQQSANRFFYELTFKPKQKQDTKEKVVTILDITPEKSIYQDYTIIAQDSILKAEVEAMEKSGVWKDMMKSIKMPKFSHKVEKKYPEMTVTYSDQISMKRFGYSDDTKLNWKILSDKEKIGEYNAQKATTEFGGRKWTAWFTTDLPFPDGPYKFHGLPGLIVKIEDDAKDYSWLLTANKKMDNWEEQSYAEKINSKYGMSTAVVMTDRTKFERSFENFKADPLAEVRPYMTPEMMSRKLPGSDKTFGEMIKDQEKMAKDYFGSNDNPIEKDAAKGKKK